MKGIDILYEDNHLLVVSKPAATPTVPDASRDPSLFDRAKDYIRISRHKPGNVFLGVIHRLDRPVSGVVCFALTSKAASRLSEQIRTGVVSKTYLALTSLPPPGTGGVLEHLLVKDRARNLVQAFAPAVSVPGGKLASTAWRLLERRGGMYLLELRPQSGRSHQLRVQCAAMGCPLAGDVKYGAAAPLPGGSIGLHALRLELLHPTRREAFAFVAPLPSAGAWAV